MAASTRIKVLKTPVAAPNAYAVCERFQGSVRRECLDHLFVLGQRHLYRVIKTYDDYFNRERPHQGLDQRVPLPVASDALGLDRSQPIRVFPVLGGLHHVYRRAA